MTRAQYFDKRSIKAEHETIWRIDKEKEMTSKRKRSSLSVIVALLLVLAGHVTQGEAGVDVKIGINLPPVVFAAPPAVVVIPGTYVYMVPGLEVDVLFFQGYWWRPYEGHWYRSRDYKGRWRYVEPRRIPNGLRALPPDYRQRLSPGHERIPHEKVRKNWKKWEKEKYWEKHRGGPGEHDRGRHGDRDRERHGDRRDRD